MRSKFRVKNPTRYPDLSRTKSFIDVSRPSFWKSSQKKVIDYQMRIYYEWLHCKSLGGKAFYYTLTYNDKHVPKYVVPCLNDKGEFFEKSFPCFKYDDIRDFVNGAFVKRLQRRFDCKFKYFITCESGEGKGKRGFGNNPHYHCIFFVYPNPIEYGYRCIDFLTPEAFRSLVREYWQGYDVDEFSKNPDPRDFKYGIAKAGSRPGHNDCGLIKSFHALTYCCKYVVKDVQSYHSESDSSLESKSNSKRNFSSERFNELKTSLWSLSFRECLSNPELQWSFASENLTESDFLKYGFRDLDSEGFLTFADWYCSKHRIDFERFIEPNVRERYHSYMKDYLSNYSGKVRISNGIGSSAVDFVLDLYNPVLDVPTSKGIKSFKVGTYLYRKLYYDVKRDPFTGRVYYALNDVGRDVLVNNLDNSLKPIQDTFINDLLKVYLGNGEFNESIVYDKIKSYVESCSKYYGVRESLPSYHDFSVMVSPFFGKSQGKSLKDLSFRYALYKKVYEGRFFTYWNVDGVDFFPPISPRSDYFYFLGDSHSLENWHLEGVDSVLLHCSELHIPYSSHPYFCEDIQLFRVLDIVSDYFSWTSSEASRKKFIERESVMNFHFS